MGFTKEDQRLIRIREELWPSSSDYIWPPPGRATGWAMVPRVTPWILNLVTEKRLSEHASVTKTYVDLLCANRGTGIIEINEEKRVAWAGLGSKKTWRKRINLLQDFHLVRVFPSGGRSYGYVVLIHPHIAVTRLKRDGLIDNQWWTEYMAIQADCAPDELHKKETVALSNEGKG